MLLDANTAFSVDQAVTADAASTDYMDLNGGAAIPGHTADLGRAIGGNGDIPLLVQVTTAFAGLTSLRVILETDDNTSFSSAKTLAESPDVPVADLVAGYQFPIQRLPDAAYERYLRVRYDVTGVGTAGAITAAIATGLQTNG